MTHAQPEEEQVQDDGKTEEQIEREMFAQAIADDPEIEDGPTPPEPEAEPEDEPEDEPPAEEPPPETAASEETPPAAEGEPEPPQPTGLEWLDELPEEKRAAAQDFIDRQGQAIARLDQRVKSHLGQLRPAQQALARVQRVNAELKQKLGQQQPQTPNIDDRKRAMNDWIDQEYADFPEEAAKLKAQFAEQLDGISRAIPAPAPPQADATPTGPNREEEVQHLATAYSDWGERRYSPEFEQWIQTQTMETASLIHSPFAADNIALLDAFTRDNPDWISPQRPEDFHSLQQAQHSPLYRGWAEGEGINPDMNLTTLPDYQRDMILTRFKTDLGAVLAEHEAETDKSNRLAKRRSQQLQDRDPGSRRMGIKPGQKIDLETDEGQRAYYDQLVAADPDLQ